MAFVLDVTLAITKIRGLGQLEARLASVGKAASIGLSQGLKGFDDQLKSVQKNAGSTASALGTAAKSQAAFSQSSSNAAKTTAIAAGALNKSAVAAQGFGDKIILAGSRYGAFVAATAVPLVLIGALGAATGAAIEFEQQLLKLDQVLSPTADRFAEIRDVIIQLSTETGVAAGEIAEAARILAQAGALTADIDIRSALEDLAKVPLLPTFEGITQATEGILAFSKQFGVSINDTGTILEKLNAVSKQFAVESSDLIEAAKRGGAAFSAFGGDIDEFIAIVATLRQTTRESASSIGTALKTISTRVIREDNIALLEKFNVQVRDNNGVLLNSIDILRNLGQGFNELSKESQRALAEQLGGFRQVGKVVAALGDGFETFDRAVEVSRGSLNTLGTDSAKALGTVGGQFNLLKAELNAFVQTLAPSVILPIVGGLIKIASAATTIAQAFAPAIELVSQFGASLLAISLIKFSPAIFALLKTVGGAVGGIAAGGGAAAAAGAAGAAAAGAGVSPVAQLAILAGLNAAVGLLTKTFLGADSATAELINRFALIGSGALALVAVLNKATIGAIAFSPLGIAIAAGTAAGLIIDATLTKAAKDVGNAIGTASSNFADRVTALDVAGSEDAIGDLAFVINTSLQEIGKVAEEEFSGITGAVANTRIRLAKSFSALGEGDLSKAFSTLFSDTTLGIEEAKRILTKDIGGSTAAFAAAVQQAFAESGTNFRNDLAKRLSKGNVRLEAPLKEVIDGLIKNIGGIEKVLDFDRAAANIKSFADEVKAIQDKLPKELFGVTLLSNVNSFTTALGKATDVINRSNERFEQRLGQDPFEIQTPRRADITPQQAEGLVRAEGLDIFGFDLPEALKGVGSATQDTLKNLKAFTDFVSQFQGAIGQADVVGKDFLKNFIENFSKDLDVDPTRLEPIFLQIGNAIEEAAKQDQLIDPKLITDTFGKAFDLSTFLPIINKGVADLLNAGQRTIELQAELSNKRAQTNIRFITDIDLGRALEDSLLNAGIALETGAQVIIKGSQSIVDAGFGIDATSFGGALDAQEAGLQQLVKVADNAEQAVTKTLERLQQVNFASADADKALAEILRDQTGGFVEASNAANVANKELNDTRIALNFLTVGLERSKQAVRDRANEEVKLAGENAEQIKRIRRGEAEQIAEIENQGNRLRATAAQIELSAAERAGGDAFGEATTAFNLSVGEFADAVRILTGSSTGGGVTTGGGAAPLSQAEQQGALTEGAFGIGGGFGELRDLLKQQAEGTKLLTLDNLGALLTGGIEQVTQNVTDTAIRALAERQQGVLAQQGITVDVATLTAQIKLAVTNGFNASNFQSMLEASLTEGQGGRVETLLEALTERAAPAQAEAQIAEQQIQATKEFATTVSGSIDKLTTSITDFFTGDDTSREGTEISTEELENAVDILGTNTDENTKAIEKATTDQETQSKALGEELGKATEAMGELKNGVAVQLEATQNISVAVSLDESLTKFQPQIESIMKNIAQDEIRQALQKLASNSTDQDRQNEVNDTLEGLA